MVIDFLSGRQRLGLVTEEPNDAEIGILDHHFNYLKSLTEQGTALLFGRTQNRDAGTFGIVIFRARSKEEAHQLWTMIRQ
jgi:uncharacterized protein YciI